MTPKDLMYLFEQQKQTLTIEEQAEELRKRADRSTELTKLHRKADVCEMNISHYEQETFHMLLRDPYSLGGAVVGMLMNISKAKCLVDHPDLYKEFDEVSARLAEIYEAS